MTLVAEKTGGKAFYNRNDLGNAVKLAMEDGGTYYALAFAPANKEADGKLHKVKLTTNRKGIELRYRQAYLSLDPSLPSKERIKYMRQEMSNALTDTQHISTGIVVYAKPGDGKFIDLTVDGHSLTFAASENNRVRIRFQVVTATFDAKGKYLKSGADVMETEFDADRMQAFLHTGARLKAPFEPSPEAKRVRVAVRDLASDRIGTVDVPLD
jgi:hypothetical protein